MEKSSKYALATAVLALALAGSLLYNYDLAQQKRGLAAALENEYNRAYYNLMENSDLLTLSLGKSRVLNDNGRAAAFATVAARAEALTDNLSVLPYLGLEVETYEQYFNRMSRDMAAIGDKLSRGAELLESDRSLLADYYTQMQEFDTALADVQKTVTADGFSFAACLEDAPVGDAAYFAPEAADKQASIPAAADKQASVPAAAQKGQNSFYNFREVAGAAISDEEALAVVDKFLRAQKLADMEVVGSYSDGRIAHFSLAAVKDDVIYYPDSVEVAVALDNGDILAYDDSKYRQNNRNRVFSDEQLAAKAGDRFADGFSVSSSRRAVIDSSSGGELLCFEHAGSVDGEEYLLYHNTLGGFEEQVLQRVQGETGELRR